MSIETRGTQIKSGDALRTMARRRCMALCRDAGLEPIDDVVDAPNELKYVASSDKSLVQVASQLASDGYHLELVVGNDEQGCRGRGRYCLYYVLSHPRTDLFLTLAYVLPNSDETYPSLRPYFACAEQFEREIGELLGLWPREQGEFHGHGARLHKESYPERLYPLRRDKSLAEIRTAVRDHFSASRDSSSESPEGSATPQSSPLRTVPDGEMLVPVGPIHAGVIEPGHFLFHLEGEVVRQLDIQLGYTHRGIERLFQKYDIRDGRAVRLAEFVSGDSAFAHSLAYCRAVEKLVDAQIPPAARLIRALFLELERIANHIGDVGALAHDLGRDVIASDVGMLRERMLELCRKFAGHRLLLGLNAPGGIVLQGPLDLKALQDGVEDIAREFAWRCRLLDAWAFRRRTRRIGVLYRAEALRLGTTGMAARASGLVRDFRLVHPDLGDTYAQVVQELVLEELDLPVVGGKPTVDSGGFYADLRTWMRTNILLIGDDHAGDVYARYRDRVHQVRISALLVQELTKLWDKSWQRRRPQYKAPIDVGGTIRRHAALGYVEGWRGDVMYWLMAEPSGQIFRCKVRDPSMLNWPAVENAVCNNYLSDFPLINKSFNLSYSGNDL